jgi:hypothetical protein
MRSLINAEWTRSTAANEQFGNHRTSARRILFFTEGRHEEVMSHRFAMARSFLPMLVV